MISVEELANRLRICDEAHNWEATWNELAASALAAVRESMVTPESVVGLCSSTELSTVD